MSSSVPKLRSSQVDANYAQKQTQLFSMTTLTNQSYNRVARTLQPEIKIKELILDMIFKVLFKNIRIIK